MIDKHSVTCPQAIRTKNRRTHKSKVYQSPGWKAAKAEFVKGKACERCGSTEKLLPHHPWKNTPDQAYEDLYLSECVVMCGTCHFMLERRHKVICPVCKENYMPIDPAVDRCWSCHLAAHPEKLVEIQGLREKRERVRKCVLAEQAAKRKADRHPCKRHKKGQVCNRSDCRCTFSGKKAPGCPYYLQKRVRV